MPCPWFWPTRPLEDARWAVPPRVPLIDPWEGECRAAGQPIVPDEETVRTRCNTGYARGACARFMDGRGDAVRFHIEQQDSGSFRILYSFERECWPAGHGVIDDSADPILARQAEAFAIGYRKRAGAVA